MAKITWKGDAVAAKINKALLDGAEEWARSGVLPLADEKCPTDSGTMKGTHAVARSDSEVVMGYGGPAAPYTVRQYEDMTLHHPSGDAKWLENAANEKISELPGILQKRVKSVL